MSKRLTTEEFISRAKEVHGDKYDYSETAYTALQKNVLIGCKKHGLFEQRAAVHLRGSGCPKCANERNGDRCRHTTEDFVAKAIAVHGNKFDYSETVYINAKTPLKIYCREHGYSWQLPNNHLNSYGCERCAAQHVRDLFTKTKEEFIKKAVSVHGDRYGYDKVEYVNCETPVTIHCDKHGDFQQRPSNHLYGHGCPQCWKEEMSAKMRMTTEEFIEKAKQVHGDSYDYSYVKYLSSDYKVTIKCNKHGLFEQDPTNHLMGQGCPECWAERRRGVLAYSTEDFIKKAREVHGDLYDYSQAIYNGCFENVYIKCDKHGGFWQRAGNHLFGQGCPHCKRSFGEEKVESFLKDNEVRFVIQYAIKNENLLCFNERFLVDFYLPDYNTFIEFNGEQHYKPVKWFGGEEKFKQQQERDYALRQYCKENNIKLIEIPYTEFNNIESVLTKELLT